VVEGARAGAAPPPCPKATHSPSPPKRPFQPPQVQLETFRGWAGKSSDINYYLNSHHIDIHNWMAGAAARPVAVTALAASGVAEGIVGRPCEDTITLSTKWVAKEGGAVGTAVYTASWIAPKVGAGRGRGVWG
jgi:hypothetical protein